MLAVLAQRGSDPGNLIEMVLYVVFFLIMAFGGWIKRKMEEKAQGEGRMASEPASVGPAPRPAESEPADAAQEMLKRLFGIPDEDEEEPFEEVYDDEPVSAPVSGRDMERVLDRGRRATAAFDAAELELKRAAAEAKADMAVVAPHVTKLHDGLSHDDNETVAVARARSLLEHYHKAMSPGEQLFVGSVVFERKSRGGLGGGYWRR